MFAAGLAALAGISLAVFAQASAGAAPAAQAADGKYIVVLRDNGADSRGVANEHARNHKAAVSRVYGNSLKGYAAAIPTAEVESVKRDPRVAYVVEDGIARTSISQTGATWGLDRIDQRSLPLNTTYNYTASGTGVDIYVLDTGIRASHQEVAGRVADGYDAVDNALPADDCNGHGTHVAGTAAGTRYGVAKNARLIPVRVLGCDGSGSWSGVISGIDYVTAQRLAGRPSVANMSLGGGLNLAVENAISNSIAKGVTYAVAAGNGSTDACSQTPSRLAAAITVGASNRNDSKSSFSNYGNCVDWFAPGEGITSAWYTGDTDTLALNGTSMATPHTAGVASLYLESNPAATPQQVRDTIYNATTKRVVSNANGTRNNHLLYNGFEAMSVKPPKNR